MREEDDGVGTAQGGGEDGVDATSLLVIRTTVIASEMVMIEETY